MEIEAYTADQAELLEIQRQLEETNKALESIRLEKIEREKKAQQDKVIAKFAKKRKEAAEQLEKAKKAADC
jgi:hypothetical protein